MSLNRHEIEHIKTRIQRKIDEFTTEADETRDPEESVVLRALADGLEAALDIIIEEDS